MLLAGADAEEDRVKATSGPEKYAPPRRDRAPLGAGRRVPSERQHQTNAEVKYRPKRHVTTWQIVAMSNRDSAACKSR